MKEVVGWYGKTYHFWEVDEAGEDGEFPWGEPRLMGSLTDGRQGDVGGLVGERDRVMGVDGEGKRALRRRRGVERPVVHVGADGWWREAEREKRGIYAGS